MERKVIFGFIISLITITLLSVLFADNLKSELNDGAKFVVTFTVVSIFIFGQWVVFYFRDWVIDAPKRNEFIRRARQMNTLVDRFRLGQLYKYCSKTTGEIWECGVYKGGTANALSIFGRTLRLFDTFEGMPETCEHDNFHKRGDFKVTEIPKIKDAIFYIGKIPRTFEGLGKCKIGFAHVDVDIYESTLACCKFIVPRLVPGGVIIFDDYGFKTCKGAKKAIDEYFGDRIQRLWTRQAIYINKGAQ